MRRGQRKARLSWGRAGSAPHLDLFEQVRNCREEIITRALKKTLSKYLIVQVFSVPRISEWMQKREAAALVSCLSLELFMDQFPQHHTGKFKTLNTQVQHQFLTISMVMLYHLGSDHAA